jgi:hypothetical protein
MAMVAGMKGRGAGEDDGELMSSEEGWRRDRRLAPTLRSSIGAAPLITQLNPTQFDRLLTYLTAAASGQLGGLSESSTDVWASSIVAVESRMTILERPPTWNWLVCSFWVGDLARRKGVKFWCWSSLQRVAEVNYLDPRAARTTV